MSFLCKITLFILNSHPLAQRLRAILFRGASFHCHLPNRIDELSQINFRRALLTPSVHKTNPGDKQAWHFGTELLSAASKRQCINK